MTKARITELELRYEALEDEITEALLHWSADDLMIAELKRRKLHIRDEVEQLRLRLVLQNWDVGVGTRASKRRSPKVSFRGQLRHKRQD